MQQIAFQDEYTDALNNCFLEQDVFGDGISKVRMIDMMPRLVPKGQTADYAIVQAARVSYGNGTKKITEDVGLIRYLMRNQHWTPFEQCEVKFHLVLPMFVLNQLVRHRTANLNVMSQRYSVVEDKYYVPKPETIRQQSQKNKQGGDQVMEDKDTVSLFLQHVEGDHGLYESFIDQGIAREQVRMLLQQNIYTEIYWKCDLRNVLNFLRLRMDHHAQWEIRQYANIMYNMIQKVFPVTIQAFDDYVQHSVLLTSVDIKALNGAKIENKREQEEFEAKRLLLGLYK